MSPIKPPSEKPLRRPTGKPTGKPTKKPMGKPIGKPIGKPVGFKKKAPTEKPIQAKPKAVGKPNPKKPNPFNRNKKAVESNVKVVSPTVKKKKSRIRGDVKELTQGIQKKRGKNVTTSPLVGDGMDDLRKTQSIKIDKQARKRTDDKKFLALRMYSYKVFNALLKGNVDQRDKNLNGDSMQIGYSEVFTLSTVTRYYVVSNLEENTPVALLNYLIKEVKTGRFWVNLSMQVVNKPYRVDFEASNITTKLNAWTKILNSESEETISSIDGKSYVKNFSRSKFLRKTARLFRSYYKLSEYAEHTKESYVIFKLQTREKKDMKIAEKRLRAILKKLSVDHHPVTGNLLDFLRGFSTISKRHTISKDTTNRVLLTNRDIADLAPYRQGKIGDSGIWFGIDKYSGSSVFLDIMNSPLAKNILLMGQTGAGKTFVMSMLLMFHNSLKHNIFIHDHKGNEFTAFTKAVRGLVISMTASKMCYINTYKIPTEGVTSADELRGHYSECFALSELVFRTITQPEPHEEKSYANIFNDYMQFVYQTQEVYADDVESYTKTRNLTPPLLYNLYVKFADPASTSIQTTHNPKHINDIKIALHKYWHPKGSRNELFLNEVSMEDIKRNRVVCFDFGMAETTRGSIPAHEEKLKKIFMNIAASRFTNFNKAKGEWTVKVVEEIQSADEDILQFTAADITEGRAKNMINYVLGNATGSLSSGSKYAKDIVENMNIQMLGKLSKSARDFFTEQFDLQKMKPDLKKIANLQEYSYCFLLHCKITDPETTSIVQMVATERVAESKFFKTVDYEKKKER